MVAAGGRGVGGAPSREPRACRLGATQLYLVLFNFGASSCALRADVLMRTTAQGRLHYYSLAAALGAAAPSPQPPASNRHQANQEIRSHQNYEGVYGIVSHRTRSGTLGLAWFGPWCLFVAVLAVW